MSWDDFDGYDGKSKRRRKKTEDVLWPFGQPKRARLPQCAWCGKGAQNPLRCLKCSGWFTSVIFCCERCAKGHIKAMHPESIQPATPDPRLAEVKNQVDVLLAEVQRLRQLKQQEADARQAKEVQRTLLKKALKDTTSLVAERQAAWQQAGSPDVQQADVDRTREDANRCWTVVREAHNKRKKTSLKLKYLKLADFTREKADWLGLGWLVFAFFGGAGCFVIGMLLAILTTRNFALGLTMSVGGFFAGFFLLLCLLYVPNDAEIEERIATLGKQQMDQVEPMEVATLKYEEAQQRYDHLASLRRLQTDYQGAIVEKQRLEEEYQTACEG